MDPNQHPTVTEWNLRTFRSRYADGSCARCRKGIEQGEQIALLPPDKRTELYGLGYLKVKTFKYVHLACLPVLLPADMIPPLVDAVRQLAARTDPKWPKDGVGFSLADHSPIMDWLGADAPRIYAGEAARRLRGYIETQLGGVESVLGAAVLLASNYRPVRITGGNGGSKVRGAAKLPTTNSATAVATVAATCGGKDVVEDKRAGAVQANGDGLKILFDPPWENRAHAVIKDALKARQCGMTWDGVAKVWRISAASLAANWEVFDGEEVTVTAGAAKRLDAVLQRSALSGAASLDDVAGEAAAAVDDLRKRIGTLTFAEGYAPYPYQEAGVAFIEQAHGKALLGDEMGVGKTAQALIYIALHSHKTLCVVPAVVAANWAIEAAIWAPSLTTQRVKKTKDVLNPDAAITVVTYDMARRRAAELCKAGFTAVICDESHYLKNAKAARTKAVLAICKRPGVQSILCLSGTPLVNRPVEFQTTLGLLRPTDFGNWFTFAQRYCDGHYEQVFIAGGKGVRKRVFKSGGQSNLDELNRRLRDVMIRRLKSQVLTELPAKTRINTPVELQPKERAAYNRAVKAAEQKMDPKAPGAMLSVITAARQAAGVAKVRATVAWVQEYAEQGQPVLVFAHHEAVRVAVLGTLTEAGLRVGRIDGKTSQDARQAAVESFQAGGLDAMVISIKAGGVGITLTRASNVLIAERAWTPPDEWQAEDRAHRIGQTDPVTVRVLVSDTEVDGDMAELLTNKAGVFTAAMDGDGEAPKDADIRKELVARWTARRKR